MTMPPQPGQAMTVTHSCYGRHCTDPITIEHVALISDNMTYRLEGTRCDGRAIHVLLNRVTGRALDDDEKVVIG